MVPVNYAPFFHMSDDDAVMTALGATSSCYLYAQGFLTFNDMHLPNVVYISGLQKRVREKKNENTAGIVNEGIIKHNKPFGEDNTLGSEKAKAAFPPETLKIFGGCNYDMNCEMQTRR